MTKIVNRCKIIKKCNGDVYGTFFAKYEIKKKAIKAIRPLQKAFYNTKKRRNYANLLLLDKSRGSKYKRRRKKTAYGLYLIKYQLFRNFYANIKERQLSAITKSTLQKCAFKFGGAINRISRLMELRIDTILLRTRFGSSIRNIRQMILHGHIRINDKVIKSPGYILQPGDFIYVKNNTNVKNFFKTYMAKKWLLPTPSYLDIDYKNFMIHVVENPNAEDIFYPFEGSIKDLLTFYDVRY